MNTASLFQIIFCIFTLFSSSLMYTLSPPPSPRSTEPMVCGVTTYYTKVPTANVYRDHSSREIIAQTHYGQQLKFLGSCRCPNGDFQVETQDKVVGWIEMKHVFQLVGYCVSYPSYSSKVAQIIIPRAHVYHQKNSSLKEIVISLPSTVKLEIVSEPADKNNRWIEVKLLDKTRAYVQRSDVAIVSETVEK